MGIGPAVGSYMGGYLADSTGNFVASIYFAMGSFIVAILAAASMPRSVELPANTQEVLEISFPENEIETVSRRR